MVDNKKHFQYLMIILIVAFFVRATYLDTPRDFWHDEAFQYLYSEKPVGFIIDSTDVHPPLFTLFTKALITVGIDTIFWLRFTMLLISLLFIAQFFFAVKEMFNKNVALYSTIFVSFVPTFIYYSTEFRNYMFVLLFTIIQIKYFNRMLKGDKKSSLYYVVFSMIMLYSHYLSGLIILSQFVYIFIFKTKIDKYKCYLISSMAALCLPLVVIIIRTIPKIQSFWFKNIDFTSLISTFTYIITQPSCRIIGFSFFFYGLLIYGLIKYRKKLKNIHIQLLFYLLLPISIMWFISQLIPFYHHRYFLFGGMSLFILVGWVVNELGRKNKDLVYFVFAMFTIMFFIGSNAVTSGFDDEILMSARALYNETGNATEDFITIHRSTFSQSPYKVYFHNKPAFLLTNLTKEQRFTAGGSVVEDYEVITELSIINDTNKTIFFVDSIPHQEDLIFSEGGLYVTKIK